MHKKKRVKKDWKRLREETALREAYITEAVNRFERIEEEREGNESVDGDWKMLQSALVGAAEELVPRVLHGRRHQWMTQEILELMKEI